jgi:hypothetical protein
MPDQELVCPIERFVESHLLVNNESVRSVAIVSSSLETQATPLKRGEVGIGIRLGTDSGLVVVNHPAGAIFYCWSALRDRGTTTVTVSPWYGTIH